MIALTNSYFGATFRNRSNHQRRKEQRGTVDMKSSWIYAKSDLITPSMQKRGFLDVSVVKNLLANVGDSRDMGSILHLLIYIHIDAFELWCWRINLRVP